MKRLILVTFVSIISLSVVAQSRQNNFYPPTSKREMEKNGILSGKQRYRLGGSNQLTLRKIDNADYYFLPSSGGQFSGSLKPLIFHKTPQFSVSRSSDR